MEFYNKGEALFGVKEYVPALLEYIKNYDVNMNFNHELIAVDGKQNIATFKVSPLVDENGWIDVDQSTLQHKKFSNIFALGDATNAPNAKTAAAVARMQAPVVATKLLYARGLSKNQAIYNGYGSCPLTVEIGKVVLAEFGYSGKVMNSFPSWIINGKRPSRLAWLLKEKLLPPIYWLGMLKGREWMAKPEKLSDKVEIAIVHSDLSQYQIAENSWDAIIMIFAHLPPAVRKQVHSQCVSGLSDNGALIIEGYTPLQLNNNTGGPKDESLLYTQSMFINDFSALSFIIFHEVEREINEGVYHFGKSNTLQLVALNRDHN